MTNKEQAQAQEIKILRQKAKDLQKDVDYWADREHELTKENAEAAQAKMELAAKLAVMTSERDALRAQVAALRAQIAVPNPPPTGTFTQEE